MVDWPTAVLVGVFGLSVGSFLNVCIHRLPLHESLVWPGSYCPKCRTPLRWYDNVPVVGYAMLRGRCRSCGTRISALYPIVEVVTAAVFVAGYLLFGLQPLLVARLLFTCAMIVLAVTDIEHRILPDKITLPGIPLGLVFNLFLPPGFTSAVIGVVTWPTALFLMGRVVSYFLKRDALGFGDVKMLAMIGAFLGWQLAFVTVFASSIIGSFFGLLGIALLGRDRYYEIPLGTFLAVAAIFTAMVGERLLGWYTGLS